MIKIIAEHDDIRIFGTDFVKAIDKHILKHYESRARFIVGLFVFYCYIMYTYVVYYMAIGAENVNRTTFPEEFYFIVGLLLSCNYSF